MTQTSKPTGDTGGIPAFLARTAPATQTAATPAPAVKAAKTPRAAKAKTAAPAKAKPAAKAKPVHVPADIAATEDNPARSIVPVKFKEQYKAHGGNNGDKVAAALAKAIETRNGDGRVVLDFKALAGIAKENGIDFSKYAHLNNGQQRMNVGNRLRGLLKAGKTVVIGGQKFANAEKALAKPPAQAAA